jgi:hypothetical protein
MSTNHSRCWRMLHPRHRVKQCESGTGRTKGADGSFRSLKPRYL